MARVSKKKAKANAELSEKWVAAQLKNISDDMKNNPSVIGNRDLFLSVLKELGCQYTEDEDDGCIQFRYQGGWFMAYASNEYFIIKVYYTYFYTMEGYDKEGQEFAKKTVNELNLSHNVKTVYTTDDDGLLHIHVKASIPFMAQIPDLSNYLRLMLDYMYAAKHSFDAEMNKYYDGR